MQIFSITSSYVVSNKEFYYFSEMLSHCARTRPHDGPLWGQSHFGIGILFSYQHRSIYKSVEKDIGFLNSWRFANIPDIFPMKNNWYIHLEQTLENWILETLFQRHYEKSSLTPNLFLKNQVVKINFNELDF